MGVRHLRPPDLGDHWDGDAPFEAAADDVVYGSPLGLQPSNCISGLQLQAQFGLGGYKSAWLMLHKLRRAMVAPDRMLLAELVEVDQAGIAYRTKGMTRRWRAGPQSCREAARDWRHRAVRGGSSATHPV